MQSLEITSEPVDNDTIRYHTVRQSAEYTYIESHLEPQRNVDEDILASRKMSGEQYLLPSDQTCCSEEEWKDNTIYVTSDYAPGQNDEEGWTDNSIYGK